MYGFTELLISWFNFFISGRAQIVKYFNYFSEQISEQKNFKKINYLNNTVEQQ